MSRKQILLVDDMELNHIIVKELLREWDLELVMAFNGEEAVQLSGVRKFDLILMDIQMPLMNGVDATRLIRGDKTNPNNSTPIIAVSANTSESDSASYLQAGMNAALSKPFDIVLFSRILSACLLIPAKDMLVPPVKNNETKGSHPVVIDLTNLLRTGNNNRAIVGLMLQSFRNSASEIVEEMASALEVRDWANIARLLHKLKFALYLMGAGSLDEEIKWIERSTAESQDGEDGELQVRVNAFITVIRELYRQAGLLIDSGEWN